MTPHFDVFRALGVEHREVYHSRFLAYLLSPHELHDQQDHFLRLFTRRLSIPVDHLSLRHATVYTEYCAGDLGRLDVFIELERSIVIAIENKIYAGEGDQQIPRYKQFLSSRFGEGAHLLFLTPSGRPPTAGSALLMSYRDLAQFIAQAREGIASKSLDTVLRQYEKVCRDIWEEQQ